MPVRKHQFEETRYKASPRFGLALRRILGDRTTEQVGTFKHPLGLVEIWTIRFHDSGTEWTALEMIKNGQQIRRSWRRCWSRQTLPALCRQFLLDHTA